MAKTLDWITFLGVGSSVDSAWLELFFKLAWPPRSCPVWMLTGLLNDLWWLRGAERTPVLQVSSECSFPHCGKRNWWSGEQAHEAQLMDGPLTACDIAWERGMVSDAKMPPHTLALSLFHRFWLVVITGCVCAIKAGIEHFLWREVWEVPRFEILVVFFFKY